jgi:CheY-like chemotaxis protein
MSRVRVVHWKPAEAEPLLEACRAAGHEVEYDPADLPATARMARRTMPEALVIDLSRAPASGRELAFAIRHTKYTRHIPLVFVDGEPEKVEAIRKQLPDALFTSRNRIASAIKTACNQVLTNPATPPTVMERYGTRSVAQKLGIKQDSTVALFDAPRDYASVLGEIPEGVELMEDPEDIQPVTLWFVRDPRDYQAELPRKRALAGRSKLWIMWTKGATNGLTGNFVREAAIEVGLVDHKICAVDARWSGMLFAPSRK